MKTLKGFFGGIAIAIAYTAAAAYVVNYFPPPGMTYSPTAGLVVGSATGGSQGAGTVNAQGVFINGAAAVTSAGLPVGANPTGTVGLTAVNGSATTYMRSDGSAPLSQAIAPTWTAEHIFAAAGSLSTPSVQLASNVPFLEFKNTAAAADSKRWDIDLTSIAFNMFSVDDAGTTAKLFLSASRTANAITSVTLGNVTDNPTFTLAGTGQTNIGGGLVVGAPSGGNQGTGTINMQGCFVNGVACSTGGASGGNPTGTVGLTAVNGVAGTYMRSDAAPPLSQAIAPTWTGTHTFSAASTVPVIINNNGATDSIEVKGITGRSALIEFAGNGNTPGTSSMAVGQDSGGNAHVLARNGANLLLGTNGTNYFTMASTGQITIAAPSSGTALDVSSLAGAAGVDIHGTGSGSGPIYGFVQNATSTGYSSWRLYNDLLTRSLEIDYSGSTYSGSLVTSGPAGESASIGTTGAFPMALATSNTARLVISASGGMYSATATGGDKGLGTLNISGTYYQNGTAIVQTGTFTATLTGMSSATTGTMAYAVAGSTCTIWPTGGGIFGTSNAITFTITGLPAICTPATTSNGVMFGDTVTDNGIAANVGVAEVGSNAVIVLGLLTNGASRPQLNNNAWTASGTKGLDSDFVITFHL